MALPTVNDLIAYLRIESEESTAETGLLTNLLARAKAAVEAWLDVPISTLSDQEFTDEGCTDPFGPSLRKLLVPYSPIDATSVVVEDKDGDTVVATDYRVKGLTGEIIADPGVLFTNPPYTITCDVGLATHPQYGTRIEPVLSQAILDLAADYYHARNPRASSESAGGGASTSYTDKIMPERVRLALQPYRNMRVG